MFLFLCLLAAHGEDRHQRASSTTKTVFVKSVFINQETCDEGVKTRSPRKEEKSDGEGLKKGLIRAGNMTQIHTFFTAALHKVVVVDVICDLSQEEEVSRCSSTRGC